jgi:hypothetical protein
MSDIEMDLTDFLIEEAAPENFDPLTFVVNDDAQAAWAMRNLAKASRRIDAIEKQGNEEAERIERWVTYATKSHRETARYFRAALESYLLRIRDEEDRKSLSLPDGDLTSRAIPAKAQVSDLGVFLKFCEETGRNQWVRIKKEADLSAMKDHVSFDGDLVLDSETGEVIEGLQHIEEAVSVQIKVSE